MKTTKEMIEILQAYMDGREIEHRKYQYGNQWSACMPSWNWQEWDYRIKQKTILVNGIEVPEPCRVMPERGEKYYYTNMDTESGVVGTRCDEDYIDQRRFERGLMHLTQAAARQHFEALIAPSRIKV